MANEQAIIYNIMEQALNTTVESLESFGQSAPDRRYVSFGQVAYDCEQLTVTMIQAYLGPPGDQAEGPQRCDGPRTGVFQVELVRPIPTGYSTKTKTGPPVEDMNEFADGLSSDIWSLLWVPNLLPDLTVIADVSVNEPSGQYVGIVLNLVVQLDHQL